MSGPVITLRFYIISIFLFPFYSCSLNTAGYDRMLTTDFDTSHGTCKLIHSDLDKTLNASNIQLLSWNIYKGNRIGWKADLKRFLQNKDVVLIQEAPFNNSLFELMRNKWRWQLSAGYNNGELQTGVLTAATVPSTKRCNYRHLEPILRTPKAALITEYGLSGTRQTLLIANVHAINFSFFTESYERQLLSIAYELRRHNGPIIFAGDFNTWNGRRQKIVEDLVKTLELKKAVFNSAELKSAFGYPLDHIYYRDLELKRRYVIKLGSSDHNAISAQFSFTTN